MTALFPITKWTGHQLGIKVARVVGNLLSQPRGAIERFVFSRQFNFGHGKPFVGAGENVYFPEVALVPYFVADFIDHGRFTEQEEAIGFFVRDLVLEFLPADANGLTFNGEVALVTLDSYPYGALGVGIEVTLFDL